MAQNSGLQRFFTLRYVVFLVFVVLAGRLFYVQIIDDRYKDLATSNIMRPEVEFPMRGEVLDRYGEYLVRSRVCYDVMVIARNIPKTGFDTLRLAEILDITPERLERQLKRAKQAPRAPYLVTGYLSQEAKLIFDEVLARNR